MGSWWLGASASLTFTGMTVEKTRPLYSSFTFAFTSLEMRVLVSYMVRTTPNILRLGLMSSLTLFIVSWSLTTPSMAKYWVCTGIMTSVAAVNVFTVSRPREGG